MAKINTLKLTKAEYVELAKADISFLAAEADYLRSPSREILALLRGIYKRIYGVEYRYVDSCGHCELTLLKAILPYYNKAKQQYNK